MFIFGRRGRRLLGKPEHKQESDIEMIMDCKLGSRNWIHLTEDDEQWLAFISTVSNFFISLKTGIILTSSATVSFSGSSLQIGHSWLSTAFAM
jgi:hypothetical protein